MQQMLLSWCNESLGDADCDIHYFTLASYVVIMVSDARSMITAYASLMVVHPSTQRVL